MKPSREMGKCIVHRPRLPVRPYSAVHAHAQIVQARFSQSSALRAKAAADRRIFTHHAQSALNSGSLAQFVVSKCLEKRDVSVSENRSVRHVCNPKNAGNMTRTAGSSPFRFRLYAWVGQTETGPCLQGRRASLNDP